jgi:voltage-gated potassium channel
MARSYTRLALQIVLIITGYYVLPLMEAPGSAVLWLRALAGLVLLALVAWWVVYEVRREMHATALEVRVDSLLLTVVVGVTAFAVADLVVARADPSQFVGLETKTDALYFALTTLATVGFGDVHAEGQLARLLVIVQLLFNVVVLTAAFRVLADAARAHRG